MNELSVEGRRLDALAQLFVRMGTDYLEPYLQLLDGELTGTESRIVDYGSLIDGGGITPLDAPPPPPLPPGAAPVTGSQWDALGAHDPFFTSLATRHGTHAKASPKDFGGGGNGFELRGTAPWAPKLTEDWNAAVAARATDMNRVIKELYTLADVVIKAVESYEDTDLYNADGLRKSTD